MKFNLSITVGNKTISEKSPVFIIAEAGVNHNGDMNMAKNLIAVAVAAGADAVKFQAFRTEELILEHVLKAEYQTKTTACHENQYAMLKKLEITQEQNTDLRRYCDEQGIIFLTTPFDEKSLDELDMLDLPAYKVASTDLTNLLFLNKIAKKNKPIFLSTGMSYMEEVEMALNEIYQWNQDVILLQCTANYPILDEEANLNVLDTFKNKFNLLLGYSDHTVGIGASPYAVVKGAKVVEKHFTLDRYAEGPDHTASLNPEQLGAFVREIRKAEKYLGQSLKLPTQSEMKNRLSLQKCLVAKHKIEAGDVFTEANVVAKRTGGVGISPIYWEQIRGKHASKSYMKDDIVSI